MLTYIMNYKCKLKKWETGVNKQQAMKIIKCFKNSY